VPQRPEITSGLFARITPLAGRQPQGFDHAWKLDARKNALRALVEAEGEKSGYRKARFAEDFALPEFAAAILDGRGMIVGQTKGARSIGSCGGRPVAQGNQTVHGPHQQLSNDAARGLLRPIEVQRNRAVRPRIFELMAAVARKDDFNTQRARSFGEAARLVAELAGE